MGEWDPDKAGENLRKHAISFDDASAALDDPHVLERRVDRDSEERNSAFAAINPTQPNQPLTAVKLWPIGSQAAIWTPAAAALMRIVLACAGGAGQKTECEHWPLRIPPPHCAVDRPLHGHRH